MPPEYQIQEIRYNILLNGYHVLTHFLLVIHLPCDFRVDGHYMKISSGICTFDYFKHRSVHIITIFHNLFQNCQHTLCHSYLISIQFSQAYRLVFSMIVTAAANKQIIFLCIRNNHFYLLLIIFRVVTLQTHNPRFNKGIQLLLKFFFCSFPLASASKRMRPHRHTSGLQNRIYYHSSVKSIGFSPARVNVFFNRCTSIRGNTHRYKNVG